MHLSPSQVKSKLTCFKFSGTDFFVIFKFLLTELVLGNQGFGDAWGPTAVLILGCDSEDVFLPFNEFGDGAAGALEGRGDSDPAYLIVLVVLLLQDVVQDLASTIILRRLPVTDDRGVPYLIEGEVDWSTRFVCRTRDSGQHLYD